MLSSSKSEDIYHNKEGIISTNYITNSIRWIKITTSLNKNPQQNRKQSFRTNLTPDAGDQGRVTQNEAPKGP